jgi:hypothetical protein
MSDYDLNLSIPGRDRPAEIRKRIGGGCGVGSPDYVAFSESRNYGLFLTNGRCDAVGEGWYHTVILKEGGGERILACARLSDVTLEIKVFENGKWSRGTIRSDAYQLTPMDYRPRGG